MLRQRFLSAIAMFLACAFVLTAMRGAPVMEHAPFTPPSLRVVIQHGHTAPITHACYLEGDRILATGSRHRTVKVWDTQTSTLLATLYGAKTEVTALVANDAGTRLLVASRDKTLFVWDTDAFYVRRVLTNSGLVRAACFIPESGAYAVAEYANIVIYDAKTNAAITTLRYHDRAIIALAYGKDDAIYSLSEEGTLVRWDAETYARGRPRTLGNEFIRTATFSREARYVLLGTQSGSVFLYDVENDTRISEATNVFRSTTGVAFSHYARYYAACGIPVRTYETPTVLLWRMGRDARTVSHAPIPLAVALPKWGRKIAVGGADAFAGGSVLKRSGEYETRLPKGTYDRAIAYAKNNAVFTGGNDGTIARFDIGVSHYTVLQPYGVPVPALCVSHSQLRVATLPRLREPARIWSSNLSFITALSRAPVNPTVCAFSRDETVLFADRNERGMRVDAWDIVTGAHITEVYTDPAQTTSVRFHPDMRSIMFIHDTHTLVYRDIATGRIRTRLEQRLPIRAPAFSPDGKYLALIGRWVPQDAANERELIMLSDVVKGRVFSMFGEEAPLSMRMLCISPDNRFLAIARDDGRVTLWNLEEGVRLGDVFAHPLPVTAFAFSPDSRFLASVAENGTLALYTVRTKTFVALVRDRSGAWFAYNEEGLCDASDDGLSHIRVFNGRREVEHAVYTARHARSDLVRKALALRGEVAGVVETNASMHPLLGKTEREVFERVNDYREGKGDTTLALHAGMTRVAREHADAILHGKHGLHDDLSRREEEVRKEQALLRFAENVLVMTNEETPARHTEDRWKRDRWARIKMEGGYNATGVGVASLDTNDMTLLAVVQLYALFP